MSGWHAGLAGKQRVIERAEFDDFDGVVATIMQVDAERIADAA
jgi:hypothetical protein